MTPKRELWYNSLSDDEKKARCMYASIKTRIKHIKSLYRRGYMSLAEMREMMKLQKYIAGVIRKEFSAKAINGSVKGLLYCPTCGHDVAQVDDLFFPARCECCGQKLLWR